MIKEKEVLFIIQFTIHIYPVGSFEEKKAKGTFQLVCEYEDTRTCGIALAWGKSFQ